MAGAPATTCGRFVNSVSNGCQLRIPSASTRSRLMCDDEPSSRSWRSWRKPLLMASAMIRAATPAATPTIEMIVMTPMTAWRRLARRYRAATKSSNCMEANARCGASRAKTHCSEVRLSSWFPAELCWKFRQQRGNGVTVLPVQIAKPGLQLRVFFPDHNRPRDGRKQQQPAESDRSGTNRPAEDFTQMAKVDGMSHLRSDPGHHQLLVVLAGFQ